MGMLEIFEKPFCIVFSFTGFERRNFDWEHTGQRNV
jgi:hypothetical protein